MLRCIVQSGSFWFTVSLITLLAGVGFTILQWDWLHPSTTAEVSKSETLRNVGLLIGGALALVFAMWRAWVAERQVETAQRQAETIQSQVEIAQSQIAIAQHQAETAEQSLLNERYQRGAEMLGSNVLAVRLGGIHALKRLAEEHPKQYHIQIMELFCTFVRLPTKENGIESHLETAEEQDEQRRTLRADVQDVVRAICSRGPAGISVEQDEEDFKLYLRDANLSYLQVRDANLSRAWLTNANLSRAVLTRANLSSARLRQANLSGAQLRRANLSDAKLWGADLSKAILNNANLSGADLCGADAHSPVYKAPVRGLTQAQMDKARADPNNPPKLDGVLDAETGKPLVWYGQPLDPGRAGIRATEPVKGE